MKAVAYEVNGPSSVLQTVDRSPRSPGAGEVRVRVVVSGVNPTDWKSRLGSGDGARLPQPQVPNQDGAGVVLEVGPGVEGLTVGQRVWIWDAAWRSPEGTAQEQVTLAVDQVVALPDGESFDTGAALGIPALTAHRALTAHEAGPAQLAPGVLDGRVVLVAGGAGAVGHAAIQLARWAGATVVTSVSSDAKAALARAAGAEQVVNYRTESLVEAVRAVSDRGVDLVVEVAPEANLEADVELLTPNGTIAIYVSESGDPLPVHVRPSMVKNIRYQFVLTYTVSEAQKAAAVAAVSAALADGALRVGEAYGLPLTRFPLEQTAAAHDAVEQATVGKVLVDVSPA